VGNEVFCSQEEKELPTYNKRGRLTGLVTFCAETAFCSGHISVYVSIVVPTFRTSGLEVAEAAGYSR
jgi:hypothetical protein